MLDGKPSTWGKYLARSKILGLSRMDPLPCQDLLFPIVRGSLERTKCCASRARPGSPPRSRWGELCRSSPNLDFEPDHQFIQVCGICLSPFPTSTTFCHTTALFSVTMTVSSAIVIYPLPFLCIEHSQVYFLLFQEPQTAAHLYGLVIASKWRVETPLLTRRVQFPQQPSLLSCCSNFVSSVAVRLCASRACSG